MKLCSVEHFFNIFSLKLDSPVIETLERLHVKKCLSNALITGESNFDVKKCSTYERFILTEIASLKNPYFRPSNLVNLLKKGRYVIRNEINH